MSYDIELICLGNDSYRVLQEAANLLNGVQDEFRFRLSSEVLREEAAGFQRTEYLTQDIWGFLRDQRVRLGGNRPYIIAFACEPLRSTAMGNIFGSHEAAEGLAAVTLHSSTQYVRETRRFCCYYMTRYALSFVNPLIRAHNDPARKNCYFHQKMYKPDIRASMDSGFICDQDLHQLDHPLLGGSAKALSSEERESLSRMRLVVSGDFPHALIMKGGGVKGLAFAGALVEIEKYFWFDRHVGTSAGSIAAVLLAGGYTPTDLVTILSQKNFREFMDAPWWKIPTNVIFKGGLFPGDHFFQWIASLLSKRISKQSEILMSDLNGAVVYASRRGPGTVVFDSANERKDTAAAFATRCSMSIPLFFAPMQIEGRSVYDGGLRNNFPVTRYLNDHPGSPFIALYLSAPNKTTKMWTINELLDIVIAGEDREVVDKHAASVVIIDTSPIGLVDFKLSQLEKDFLQKVGRASALRFLQDRMLDNGPLDAVVVAAVEEAEACREKVRERRARKRRLRLTRSAVILGCVAFLVLIANYGHWILPVSFREQKGDIDRVDADLLVYRRLIVGDSIRVSNSNLLSRPEVIEFTWRQPVALGVEQFELCLESRGYGLSGYAVERQESGGLQSLSVQPLDAKGISVVLESSAKTAYLFYRRDFPATTVYDSKYDDPDLSWSIGRVGKSTCSADKSSHR